MHNLIIKYVACIEKRFYTRGTWKGIRIFDWINPLPFFVIGWDPWIRKRFNYLSYIEEKGVCKTFTVLHKLPRNLLIYYKVYFMYSVQWAKIIYMPQKCQIIFGGYLIKFIFFNKFWTSGPGFFFVLLIIQLLLYKLLRQQ